MEPIVRVPIVSQVENRIRELIDSKKYTEGMKLPTEYELCQSMNVGRGTVREALRLLQAKGLVEEFEKSELVDYLPAESVVEGAKSPADTYKDIYAMLY